jgi:hypothetical protein
LPQNCVMTDAVCATCECIILFGAN